MIEIVTGQRYGFKRKWTEEQEQWLLDHRDIQGKKLIWEMFHTAFPQTTFTVAAISAKRTELGAYAIHLENWQHRSAKPLYSEQCKKGYIKIKVAKYEWWQKQKWVWVATHPGEEFSIKNQFLFLDGDRRNFDWRNIRKVDHRVIGVINRTYGGLKKGCPEENDILITKVELKLALLDRAEKVGLVTDYGSGRMLNARKNELARLERKARFARMTPEELAEYKAKNAVRTKEYLAKKRQNPEWLTRHRAYQAEWERKRREKSNNEKAKKRN